MTHLRPLLDGSLWDFLSLELDEVEVLWKLLGSEAFEFGVSKRLLIDIEDEWGLKVEVGVFEKLRGEKEGDEVQRRRRQGRCDPVILLTLGRRKRASETPSRLSLCKKRERREEEEESASFDRETSRNASTLAFRKAESRER